MYNNVISKKTLGKRLWENEFGKFSPITVEHGGM